MIQIALIATDRILLDLAALLAKVSANESRFDRIHDFDRLIIVFVDELSSTNSAVNEMSLQSTITNLSVRTARMKMVH